VKERTIHHLEQRHSLLGKPKLAAFGLERGIAVDIGPCLPFQCYRMASTCGIRWTIPLGTFGIGPAVEHAVAFVQLLAGPLDC